MSSGGVVNVTNIEIDPATLGAGQNQVRVSLRITSNTDVAQPVTIVTRHRTEYLSINSYLSLAQGSLRDGT
jgi:hypothetical protein